MFTGAYSDGLEDPTVQRAPPTPPVSRRPTVIHTPELWLRSPPSEIKASRSQCGARQSRCFPPIGRGPRCGRILRTSPHLLLWTRVGVFSGKHQSSGTAMTRKVVKAGSSSSHNTYWWRLYSLGVEAISCSDILRLKYLTPYMSFVFCMLHDNESTYARKYLCTLLSTIAPFFHSISHKLTLLYTWLVSKQIHFIFCSNIMV